MLSEMRNGRPAQAPATRAHIEPAPAKKPADVDQGSGAGRQSRDVVAVWGVGYPPAGRRRFWIVILLCPTCRGYHSHRTGSRGGRRRAGCGQGEYIVRVRRPLASAGRAA